MGHESGNSATNPDFANAKSRRVICAKFDVFALLLSKSPEKLNFTHRRAISILFRAAVAVRLDKYTEPPIMNRKAA